MLPFFFPVLFEVPGLDYPRKHHLEFFKNRRQKRIDTYPKPLISDV